MDKKEYRTLDLLRPAVRRLGPGIHSDESSGEELL